MKTNFTKQTERTYESITYTSALSVVRKKK